MKVNFEPTTTTKYNYSLRVLEKPEQDIPPKIPDTNYELPPSNLSLANFRNVSFGMNVDAKFLLGQCRNLRCAYSGREMLPLAEARNLYQKLTKRPNAQSAINLLFHYTKYMHDIESTVFDIFCEAPHKNKRDFQNILKELKPDSLENLKEKQYKILTSTDSIIDSLGEQQAERVIEIRDMSLDKIMNNGVFGRKSPLDMIKAIQAPPEDLDKIIKIYQAWYKLPSSSKDLDAFIVKYAKATHEEIAKRLISTAVGSIEHIKPSQRNGEDKLGNYLLVSATFNNNRSSMPLNEYIMLNNELNITKNLQIYMDDVIGEVNNPKSPFAERSYYPESIQKAIRNETRNKVLLNTDKLRISKAQHRENSAVQHLGRRYIVIQK